MDKLGRKKSKKVDEELEYKKLVERAIEVLSKGYPTASTSLFQRELLIGHTTATRLMNTLGKRGVLGEWSSPLSRKVLINPVFCPAQNKLDQKARNN